MKPRLTDQDMAAPSPARVREMSEAGMVCFWNTASGTWDFVPGDSFARDVTRRGYTADRREGSAIQ